MRIPLPLARLSLVLSLAGICASAVDAWAGQQRSGAPADIVRLAAQLEQQQARLVELETQVAQLRAAASIRVPEQRYGSMPLDWASWTHLAVGPRVPGQPASLAGVFGQVQHDAMPEGGPQGLESYVWDDHQSGVTRLITVAPQTVEIAGAGTTREVRSRGGVVTGPGRVDFWNMFGGGVSILNPSASVGVLCAVCPNFLPGVKPADRKRGVWIPETDVENLLGGGLTVPAVTFTNGWSLRVDGDRLLLRDPAGSVRAFP